jgi:hypothetical protein
VRAYQDEFVLAGGAEEVELTYLPLTYSEHTYLNGVYQREGDDYDWTRESGTRTVTVKAAMDARAGDILIVEYLYYAGTPVRPTTVVDFPSGPAWWYRFDDDVTATSFADSGVSGAYAASVGSLASLGQTSLNGSGGASMQAVNGGSYSYPGLATGLGPVSLPTINSMGGWFRFTGSSVGGTLMQGNVSNAGAVQTIWFGCSPTYASFGIGSSFVASSILSADVLDGDTHHLATTWTGGTLKIYIDGALADTLAVANSPHPFSQSVIQLYDGLVDDLAGWTRVLTAQEILDWYESGTT